MLMHSLCSPSHILCKTVHMIPPDPRPPRSQVAEVVADLECDMRQPHGARGGGRRSSPDLQHCEVVMTAAPGEEDHAIRRVPGKFSETQDFAIERHGPVDVPHLENDVPQSLDHGPPSCESSLICDTLGYRRPGRKPTRETGWKKLQGPVGWGGLDGRPTIWGRAFSLTPFA